MEFLIALIFIPFAAGTDYVSVSSFTRMRLNHGQTKMFVQAFLYYMGLSCISYFGMNYGDAEFV